jgi:hypothetical protein
MKTRPLIGKFAQLPNGNKVIIVYVDGSRAVCRRLGGPKKGLRAVCNMSSLSIHKKGDEASPSP